jgi:hypothetical protein
MVKFFLIAILLMPSFLFGQSAAGPRHEQVAKFVEEYCRREFNGERDFRVVHSKWDQEVLRRVREYNDMEPGYFNVLNDPIVIIDRFEIKRIDETKNQHSVTVMYHYLARTKGHGKDRSLVFESGDMEKTLIWSFSGGQFFIHNPVVTMVSLRAVIKEYEESYAGWYSCDGDKVSYHFPKDYRVPSPGAKRIMKDINDLVKLKKLLATPKPSK